jgi:UDP-glucose 4-epimerase
VVLSSPLNNQVLVTGGAGFIGSHLVDRLVDDGFDVLILDNLWSGSLDNVRTQLQGKSVRFVKGDIRDYQTVRNVTEGNTAVFHLAGVTSVLWSIQNPAETHEVNATGTLNILRASVEAKVTKLIFASSCAVYGDPSRLPIGEEHPTNPMSPYAASKLAAEGYVNVFAKTFGLESTCLRFFNVYGPRQPGGDSGGVIPRFALRLSEGISPTIYGDGEQQRDFVFVEDVVEALVRAFKAVGGPGEVYNIGSGKAFTVNKVFSIIRHRLGKDGIQADHIPAKPGEIRGSVADIRKATAAFGFKPTVSLENGIELTLPERAVYGGK